MESLWGDERIYMSIYLGKGSKEPMGSNNNSVASNGMAGNLMNSTMEHFSSTKMGNSSTPSPLGNIVMKDESVGGMNFTSTAGMPGGGMGDVEMGRNAFGEAMPRNGLFGA